jgi:CRISPR-associated exonuclease Cas4
LVGIADCVEFIRDDQGAETARPVEHKRGRPKVDDRDRVQVCAQALCLEEMTGRPVPDGVLFYHATRQRLVVRIDAALRRRTEQAVGAVRALIASGHTPPPTDRPDCPRCSLVDLCLPRAVGDSPSAAAYFAGAG